MLANRLLNAVENYRITQALERSEEKFSKMVENSSDFISIVSADERFEYVSPASAHIIEVGNCEMIGKSVFRYVHPDDREEVMRVFFEAVEHPDMRPTVQFRLIRDDDERVVVESRGKNLLDDDVIEGFVVNTRDITDLKTREWALKEQNEKLEHVQHALSKDLQAPLGILADSLELYRDTRDESYLDNIDSAIDRMATLLEQLVRLTDTDVVVEDTTTVDLREAACTAWQSIDRDTGALRIHDSRTFEANPEGLYELFEQLFTNAIEHSHSPVTIDVGTMSDGVYVEDDGLGIDPGDRRDVFESGYTTVAENTGLGLTIAGQVASGHGWEISVTEGAVGGARFEITGIDFLPDVY